MKNEPKLTAIAEKVYLKLIGQVEETDHNKFIVRTIATSYAHLLEAERLVREDGIVIDGKFGKKAHPANTIIKDNRIVLDKMWSQLKLDKVEDDEFI